MFASMTIRALYRHFLNELRLIYNENESAMITQMIFEEMADINRSEVIKNSAASLPEKYVTKLMQCLERLKLSEPVQYVIGHAWFYKMKFKVTPAVLIPRPETEELVEEAILFLKKRDKADVLDIGTGSGCIPITMKKNLPFAQITSIDISNDALKIAKENMLENDVYVDFKEMDFLIDKNRDLLEKYDVIISNPPYIPEEEKKYMSNNVAKYEPYLALFVDDRNPLIFYQKIASFGKLHLKKEGKIFLEAHENYAQEVKDVFQNENYMTEVKKDIFGKERIIVATHCR
jgi:release factor glutamine methyltransferase